MADQRDYYSILQVSPQADPAIIKAAYYTQLKVLKKHPDLGGSHEEATRLNEAYEVLSDPVRRREYDRKNLQGEKKANVSTSPVQPEQRRAMRALFHQNLKFRVYQKEGDWKEAQFRDISLLGACFRSAEKFKAGQTLEFDISDDPLVRAIAGVRWVRTIPQRFGQPLYEGGVEFEKINQPLFQQFLKKAGLEILL